MVTLMILVTLFSDVVLADDLLTIDGPDCEFTLYGVTYMGWNIGNGRCFVATYDAEDGTFLSMYSGLCSGC